MRRSSVEGVFFFLLSALVHDGHSLVYSDLEAEGLSCPQRDKCAGYANNASYIDRSCECDSECQRYGDCCIDAPSRTNGSKAQNTIGNGMICMPYGDTPRAGIYVITRCRSDWNGSLQVRERCESRQDNFTDPLAAVPVTNVNSNKTYRNRYCAECNNAALDSLALFRFHIGCDGLHDIPTEQLLADITYSSIWKMWGVNRLNSFGNDTQFYGCEISFDVPGYLNNSVRFCRLDLISSCSPTWRRNAVRSACKEYMAVVFDGNSAYHNPHCALCNNKRIDDLSCTTDIIGRKRPMYFSVLLDVNRFDGDQVGKRQLTFLHMFKRNSGNGDKLEMETIATPECAEKQKYDPFFKKCRELVCALPGYAVVNGKCVRG